MRGLAKSELDFRAYVDICSILLIFNCYLWAKRGYRPISLNAS